VDLEIKQAYSPNFSIGRNGRLPIAIVNHITAGLMPGTLSWLQNPSAQASAHYLVTKTGEIYQLVADENTAWHAGIVNNPDWPLYDGTNPNRYTIGIEHECLEGGELTEAQYQATLWLHRQLIVKWGIPIDTDHIIGHYRIDSVNRPNDPGPSFPWEKLFLDLKGEGDMGIPAGAKETSIEIGGVKYPTYILNNTLYFQGGVPVRPVIEGVPRKFEWLDKEFRMVLK
jgi:N-acetyl-anhydromuramyl-L-alanine amidase AmpD